MPEVVTYRRAHQNEPRDAGFCELDVILHFDLQAPAYERPVVSLRSSVPGANIVSVLFLVWQESRARYVCDPTFAPLRSKLLPLSSISNSPVLI